MRTYKDAKIIAKSLRDSLAARSVLLSHSECLEIVAQEFGFENWNTLSAKLDVEKGRPVPEQDTGIEMEPGIPLLRVASLREASSFYSDFLGFRFDWGLSADSTYAQISRSGVTLHLDTNSQNGAAVLIRMQGLDVLHRELSRTSENFSPTDISYTPWDSRVFRVIDPFGNHLRFWENNPPGIARSIRESGM